MTRGCTSTRASLTSSTILVVPIEVIVVNVVVSVIVRIVILCVDVLRHLPDLQDVIVRHRCHDPVLVGAEGKVVELAGVAAVDEEELGGAVLGVLRGLLLADAGQVPDIDAAVGRRRAENCALAEWRPGHVEDLGGVALEDGKGIREVAKVPQADVCVARARGEHVLLAGVESYGVHIHLVGVKLSVRRALGVLLPDVPHPDRPVVANAADHVGVEHVPSHILHHVGVAAELGHSVDADGTASRLQVPHAHELVVTAAHQMPLLGLVRAPAQAIAVGGVAAKAVLRAKRGVRGGEARVLGEVEDEDLLAGAPGGN
mmetsp:Transcript_20161/g.42009  ORF Transcript_20161/g.42009 Transcript_20161/m.42009 type:complete len:315 (-) Transcript_20161:232-1176(-)